MSVKRGAGWHLAQPTCSRSKTALPRLAATADSPWWDGKRAERVKLAWDNSLAHLKATLGDDPSQWQWGKAHTLTHGHPLGLQKPLDKIFNVGPFPAPGTHEVPNNQSAVIGPAPWPVTYGPSTRRLIDFATPSHGLTIIPVTHVREVLAQALVRQPEPVEWDEAAEEAAAAARALASSAPAPTTH